MSNKRHRSIYINDNFDGLASIPSRSVDLAYLDPPFNTKRSYDAVLSTSRDTAEAHRRRVFTDNWSWRDEMEKAYEQLPGQVCGHVFDLIQGLIRSLGRIDLTAYLVMMAPRLTQSERALRDTGSIYLHCDSTASHYLKLLLDHIFGPQNFRNQIVWKRTHAHSSSRKYGPVHDLILFYSKSDRYTWNRLHSPYEQTYLDTHFTHEDGQGRYQLITCTAPGDRTGTRAHYEWRGKLPPPGRHWAWTTERMEEFDSQGRIVHSSSGIPRLKRYINDGLGVVLQDLWLDINPVHAHSEERVGYETQKPLALLERIILASSNPGDTVIDPFCGTGTALVAAERLKRQWIGMDSSILAGSIALARVRQEIHLGQVSLVGFPATRSEAIRLLRSDPISFGVWGASMLATITDRKTFNGSVAMGSGKLRIGQKSFQLVSWIPLNHDVSVAIPTIDRGPLAKAGLILKVDRGHSQLRRWLNEHVKIAIHEVPLENLFERDSMIRGLASRVLSVGQTT